MSRATPPPRVEHVRSTDRPEVKRAVWAKYPQLTSDAPKIVLMGDSVLDNFHWLDDPSRPLRRVLQDLVKENEDTRQYEVINLAVDQMQTYDFLRRTRDNSWRGYEASKRGETVGKADIDPMDTTYEYCEAEDGNIYSVENLRRLQNVKYVVVSLGGNDVYLDASNQEKLFKSMLPCHTHLRDEVARDFKERFKYLFEQLHAAAPEATVVPVLVYHPHNDFSISGIQEGFMGGCLKFVQKLHLRHLVTPIARASLEIAQEFGLPVIDLSQTFDPSNERHYGVMQKRHPTRYWSGAEPSDVSQVFIAKLIQTVLTSYRPSSGPALFYGTTKGDDLESTRGVQLSSEYVQHYVFSQGAERYENPYE